MSESEPKTLDPLAQQMIKADALMVTLAQVRDDLRKQANQIDTIIKMVEAQDKLTGLADALTGSDVGAKQRLVNLMRKMKPELAELSDEEVMKRVGGVKK